MPNPTALIEAYDDDDGEEHFEIGGEVFEGDVRLYEVQLKIEKAHAKMVEDAVRAERQKAIDMLKAAFTVGTPGAIIASALIECHEREIRQGESKEPHQ